MGRIWSPGKYVARPEWYDRNPSVSGLSVTISDAAPHAAAERTNYTVPTGKKVLIESLEVGLLRKTAPTTNGVARCWAVFQAATGISVRILDATVGAKDRANIGTSWILLEGQVLRFYTEDLGTGGTIDYWAHAKFTIFDA